MTRINQIKNQKVSTKSKSKQSPKRKPTKKRLSNLLKKNKPYASKKRNSKQKKRTVKSDRSASPAVKELNSEPIYNTWKPLYPRAHKTQPVYHRINNNNTTPVYHRINNNNRTVSECSDAVMQKCCKQNRNQESNHLYAKLGNNANPKQLFYSSVTGK